MSAKPPQHWHILSYSNRVLYLELKYSLFACPGQVILLTDKWKKTTGNTYRFYKLFLSHMVLFLTVNFEVDKQF